MLGAEVLVGAGTVRTLGEVIGPRRWGLRSSCPPTLALEVAGWARENDVLHIPGVLTPNEVEEALRAGAGIVKIFPAGPLGPGYLRALRGPFPDLRVVATGGIDATSVGAYLEAGAVAVALGSWLVNEDAVGRPEALTRRAAEAVDAIAATGGPR
jgi:2-dehydro-3-deoxyphosphogluconate aldolase/(4S)-4-hydroxy-2-oxoglutarate aldolase